MWGRLALTDLRCAASRYGDAQREVYVMGLARDLAPAPQEIHRGENWSVFSFMDGGCWKGCPNIPVRRLRR